MRTDVWQAGRIYLFHSLYHTMEKVPFIKGYLHSLKRMLELMKPQPEEIIEAEAFVMLILVYGMTGFFYLILSAVLRWTVFYGMIAGVVFYLWSRHLFLLIRGHLERNFQKEFRIFLGTFYNRYAALRSVEEALLESIDKLDNGIIYHLQQIYDLLLQEDVDQIREYQNNCISPYLYSFLVYSYLEVLYGDGKMDSEFSYVKAVNSLEQQIYQESLRKERMRNLFMGLIPIVLLPVLFLYSIEKWGIFNLPQLTSYYHNSYGCVVCYILLIATIGCYEAVMWLKEDMEIFFFQSPLLQKLASLFLVRYCFIMWSEHHPKQVQMLNEKLRQISSRISLEEFCASRVLMSFLTSLFSIFLFVLSGQVKGWNIFVVFLLVTVVTVLAYQAPFFGLLVKCYLMESEMEQEVMRFHGLLSMFANLDKSDVLTVLEWLEKASVIFYPSLAECVDEYCSDSSEALETLKEKETYLPFQKIAEALIASEEIGMKKAMDSLATQQKYLLYKQKQDNEIRAQNRGAIGEVIAFMPMVLTIFLYLIIPFVLESLVQLREYVMELKLVQ